MHFQFPFFGFNFVIVRIMAADLQNLFSFNNKETKIVSTLH